MREKLDDTALTNLPFARLQRYLRPGRNVDQIKLIFNTTASKLYQFKPKDRVNLYWNRHDETWERPVLIVKKNGSQRAVSLYLSGKDRNPSFSIAVSRIIRQFDIPLHPFPLPILDFVDGEIWIDFQGNMEESTPQHKYWQQKYGKKTKLWFSLSKHLQMDMRTTKEFYSVVKMMAELEGSSVSALILSLLADRLQDRYAPMWDAFVEGLKEQSEVYGG